jgi:hypothetical protein
MVSVTVTVCVPSAAGLPAEAVTLTTESDRVPCAGTAAGTASSARASSPPLQCLMLLLIMRSS